MQSVKKLGFVLGMAVLGAVVASLPARAEGDRRISVNIPFDFVVGNSTLKAGDYRVQELEKGVLDFGSADGQKHHFAIAESAPGNGRRSDPYLVFTRYGSEVFLSKIALSVDDSYEVQRSAREKQLIDNQMTGERNALVVQSGR